MWACGDIRHQPVYSEDATSHPGPQQTCMARTPPRQPRSHTFAHSHVPDAATHTTSGRAAPVTDPALHHKTLSNNRSNSRIARTRLAARTHPVPRTEVLTRRETGQAIRRPGVVVCTWHAADQRSCSCPGQETSASRRGEPTRRLAGGSKGRTSTAPGADSAPDVHFLPCSKEGTSTAIGKCG